MWADREQRANCVAYDITQKFGHFSSLRLECCIFKVYDSLKRVNEEAYKPKIVCIGPYHHHNRYQNTTMKLIEEYKLHCLKNFVPKTRESVLTCVKAMQDLEESARNCYAEPTNDLNSNEFVEMMLLDSCFIVEFLQKYYTKSLRDENDTIFQIGPITMGIIKDLFLLENQLPFFVLDKVFKMMDINLATSIDMAIFAFKDLLPSIDLSSVLSSVCEIENVEIKHLLGLMHYCWCFPMLSEGNAQAANNDGTINRNRCMGSTVQLIIEQVPTRCCFPAVELTHSHRCPGEHQFIKKDGLIKAVTELQEFGIEFKRSDSRKLFDIRFENGTIQIPPLLVGDDTESILRNLIAYEQCLPISINNHHPKYFTDYVLIMDDLVDSSKDVEKLRHKEIILNVVGLDEVVSTMFNKLGLGIFPSTKFFYSDICTKLNEHCEQKCNRQMANLRQNYCNSPWAFISVFAAVLLLLLTMVQAVCSILSVIKDP